MNKINSIRKDWSLIETLITQDRKILDIGCGGGLISEPMCRLGGKITGIDASEKNVKIARKYSAHE